MIEVRSGPIREVSCKSMDTLLKMGDADSGVKICDLLDSPEFRSRRHRDERLPDRDARAIEKLNASCLDETTAALRQLVEIAVEFCPADSAGISLEEVSEKGDPQFRWVAVAGSFAQYLNGTTPRSYSPCGTCIDRGVPQLYQVHNPYYNFLGVTAQPILDGILIPWRSGEMQGTLWAVSHHAEDTFDRSDYDFLRTVADFVSRAIRKH